MPTALRPAEFPWFRYDGYSFSLGVTDGARAWLSGHSASEHDPDTGRIVVRGGMAAQARTAYAKIAAILEAGGLGVGDAVHVVENVTVAGLAGYAEAAAVRAEVFGGHAPAVSTVVVERLLRPAALIEVEVRAARGAPDGTVALPTLLPIDDQGDVVHPGDLLGQYAYCLDRADTLLRAAGLSLDAAVTTYDWTTPATRDVYRRTHRARAERLGGAGVYPGAGGVLVSGLHRPGVLVALEVTASRHPLAAVNPGWSRYDTLTYTPGVRAGDTLFMSGFAALDMATQEALHPGDVAAQAEVVYAAIGEVLAAAGLGPEHLVSTIEFVTPDGLAGYRGVADVRKRMLREPWPASTGSVCAGLLRPEFQLEVFPLAVAS